MSRDMKSVNEMVDYVRQLRLHAAGRRAIHVHLSGLEKHYRDEHARRFVAVTLRQLITNFGATMFALPNSDVVLIVKGAKVENIDPLLNHIRRKYRDSELIKGLDPIQGQDDAFVRWFNLEADYTGFRDYIEKLAEKISGATGPEETSEEAPEEARASGPGALEIAARSAERVALPKNMRMVPIEAPAREVEQRELDPELVVVLTKALIVADVSGMLRKQDVMAVLGIHQPQPVMVHKYVPAHVVYEKLLETRVLGKNLWLQGYLADLLASRVLFSEPNLQNENSIASSLRVTCSSVMEPVFDEFNLSLGNQPRSTVILEFSATDIITNFDIYRKALRKTGPLGYRVMVADLDIRALLWFDYEKFDADFVKLEMPSGAVADWLDPEIEDLLHNQISDIGIARVILAGCDNQEAVETGQRLGITLFQGEAVAPMTT